MGKETAPPPPTADQAAEAVVIKKWVENATKNPKENLEAFLRHMKGWLQENQALYQERKNRYEAAKSAAQKNPNAHPPFPDPFVVNYEMAQDLANRLLGKLTRQGDATSEYDEAKISSPSDEVKKMVNTLWTRTVLPPMPMISNVVLNGVRHLLFEDRSEAPPKVSSLDVYPSGAIIVTHKGTTTRYLPPFPNVELQFYQFRQG